jgi:hypothetical protein
VSDRAVVVELVGKAYQETDLSDAEFADLLAAEAERYRESAEDAGRPVDREWPHNHVGGHQDD